MVTVLWVFSPPSLTLIPFPPSPALHPSPPPPLVTQGPFKHSKIFSWKKDGYLEDNLLIREVKDGLEGEDNPERYLPISIVPEFAE